MGDFVRNYMDNLEVKRVPGKDKYFHCKANCEATRRGPLGENEAESLSDFKEFIDQYVQFDPAEESVADQIANRCGREGAKANPDVPCRNVCQSHRPLGLDESYLT
jgi:hypothetical protein